MQEQIFRDVISHKFPADKVTLFLEYAFKTIKCACAARQLAFSLYRSKFVITRYLFLFCELRQIRTRKRVLKFKKIAAW